MATSDGNTTAGAESTRGITLPLTFAVVLTVVTGAMDAISFTRLGEVFSSVMTGNLVLLGLSAGRADGGLAVHVAIAVGGFVLGVLIAGAMAGRPGGPATGWPTKVRGALVIELVALGGFLGVWTGSAARPGGGQQLVLLLLAATAMGVQTGAIRAIGVTGLSTTYLTGTLAGVVATLVTDGRLERRNICILAALVAGAAAAGLLVIHAPAAAPALPVGLLVVALLGSVLR